ncbi:cyanophycinase [uncultured Algimonas sp.]|uniref:cyanophycinase n=1 Tax=uncultured Algimonas sp. TaxID=1547920 RepID=UPI002619BECA|nr:cyanophycinase [uncultured Algimonas sp.]
MERYGRLFAGLAVCAALSAPARAADGTLVIAGGGVDAANADVWGAFVRAAEGDGPVVIVLSASGRPSESGGSARDALIRHGADPDAVRVAPLAVMDDPSTPDTDESLWAANATDPEIAGLLRSASAIWFTGGDQSRTTALLRPDGRATPALSAILAAHRDSAAVGGTSAGAAVLSDPMIVQGDSFTALTGATDGEPVRLSPGLGVFAPGIVDQHFGERARLGRLVAALAQLEEPSRRIGVGIDEGTALVAPPDGRHRIVGRGYVTIVDARYARFEPAGPVPGLRARGVLLHLASGGDRLDADGLAPVPAGWKTATLGHEYAERPRPGGGGLAFPRETLADLLGEGLLDNSGSRVADRISFDMSGTGLRYRFRQSDASSGYWGRPPDGGPGRYTIRAAEFGFEPVRVAIDGKTEETQ